MYAYAAKRRHSAHPTVLGNKNKKNRTTKKMKEEEAC
jgi:hypothetical protein